MYVYDCFRVFYRECLGYNLGLLNLVGFFCVKDRIKWRVYVCGGGGGVFG